MDTALLRTYVEDAFARMLQVAERVGPRLGDRPAGASTNAVGALVVHCTEVCEFWFGHVVLGRPSDRDRDAEFVATPTLEELRARVAATTARVADDLAAMAAGRGGQPSELRVFAIGDGSDEAVALYVLKELHQHLGHMELAADVLAQPLYHLAIEEEWRAAVAAGGPYDRSTRGASFDEVGFVHCSFLHQVDPTRERHYGGRDDVVLLVVDPERVGAEVRVEDLAGSGEAFPHVYGTLPLESVLEARPLGRHGRPG